MGAKKKQWKRERKVIIFDENSRREYLLGFRKRKNERRRKAKEDLLKREKDRKKELKVERKRALLDQIATRRKELEALESDHESDDKELVADLPVDTTYDYPDHVVTVTTISDINLDSGKFACIGPNRGLPETVVPPVLNNSDLQNPCTKKEARIEKSISKKRKLHNNFKRKQTSVQNEWRQDGKSGRRRKRKNFHSHGKSKQSKMS